MEKYFTSQLSEINFRKIPLIFVFACAIALSLASFHPAHAIVSNDTQYNDENFPFPINHQNMPFCQGNTSEGPVGCY